MKKIAVIHTTPATIQSLTELIKEILPEAEIMNLLDDSILPDMIQEKNLSKVETRWMTYAQMAELAGADAVLSACSTVGEIARRANDKLSIPVFRIDEAMAEQAVLAGVNIRIYATLNSTMTPTERLIRQKAEDAGRRCDISTELVSGAYEALMQGDKAEHDRRILECVSAGLEQSDVVVLAQASMAGALSALDEEKRKKVLTSPRLGIEYLKKQMDRT